MSKMYQHPMTNDEIGSLTQRLDLVNDRIEMAEQGFGGAAIARSGVTPNYDRQTGLWAGIATAEAKRTGRDRFEVLSDYHKDGFNQDRQSNMLAELFPTQMRKYQTSSGGYTYPPMGELSEWLRDDYDVNGQSSLFEMLEEAAK